MAPEQVGKLFNFLNVEFFFQKDRVKIIVLILSATQCKPLDIMYKQI